MRIRQLDVSTSSGPVRTSQASALQPWTLSLGHRRQLG